MTARPDNDETTHDAVVEAAADWFARAQGQALSPDDLKRFEQWLGADEAHREAYEDVAAVWTNAHNARLEPQVLHVREQARRRVGRNRQRVLFGRLAAGLVAAVAIGLGVAYLTPSGATTYSTRLGETATYKLTDGSTVVLDTDSAVKVWSRRRGPRQLAMVRGRAFFEVAHDSKRPFVVRVGNGSVTATGTAFDIRTETNGMKVVLVEGSVRVQPVGGARDSAPVEMQAGQQLVNTGAAVRLQTTNAGEETNWRFGMLVFRDRPLSSVVEELNRYSARKIEVSDRATGRRLVNGVLKPSDPMPFLASIEASRIARVDTSDPDRIVIGAP